MALTANQLLQALADAGIDSKEDLTQVFKIIRKQLRVNRMHNLISRQMNGESLTTAEQAELTNGEDGPVNLAQLL